ncbi:MAG: L-seryl-tRNA(Sec) selenium transferase [Chloroflexota bacterium]
MNDSNLRDLPGVDRLLSDERIDRLTGAFSRDVVVDLIRSQLSQIRQSVIDGQTVPSFDEIVSSIAARMHHLEKPGIRPVINATGVILHTNLGRAPLSIETMKAMEIASRGYSNLEFDLDTGKRGSRHVHLESLLCQLTGAESALVVNNNAGAVLLALTALAKRKEVIVSRGQGVQIGGGFRIPDVMQQGGAKLVEVGTTNCTYLEDYERAITPRTAAILRVHSSNFKIIGFTHSVSLGELVALGRKYRLPILDDIGSGCFIRTGTFGLDAEPVVQDSITDGASLVLFSGDKLLGGPQAGIILGHKDLVTKIKKHALARAVRIDKIRLAGLSATLIHYLKGEAMEKIPVLRMIATPLKELERRAEMWAASIGNQASTTPGESMVGGGSLPESTLPTKLVVIKLPGEGSVQRMAWMLRRREPPVIGRVLKNSLLLDPRSVFPEEDRMLIEAVREAMAALPHAGKKEINQ